MQYRPLAERMRPTNLNNYIGQDHLVGIEGPIRLLLAQKQPQSMLFWGPPGVGKTTLAQIVANELELPFISLSAIDCGVKEVRSVIDTAKKNGKIILFIDEIHRFNKAQQDSLLGAVEKGYITLIGATTENPSFEVINALLSRCQLFILKELTINDLKEIAIRAIAEDDLLSTKNIIIEEWDAMLQLSGGDGRKMLNILELLVQTIQQDKIIINNTNTQQIIQQRVATYDKNGEQHYDIISAFIKSIRGSDPNAAVYYLARMIDGGEDPKFIARRLLILASEDIGNANPNALLLATSTFQAVQMIGWPESRIILSQCTTYLACSPKSNAAYEAINQAEALVKASGDLPVPLAIRNAPTKLMKDLQYGANYKYAHTCENNFAAMEFLPISIAGTKLYQPGNNSSEQKQLQFLKERWKSKYGY
jgi:putative ATPase